MIANLILYLFRSRIKYNSNKVYINYKNNSILNNNIVINYLKNNKIINNRNKINDNNNKNNSVKNESYFFHFNNEYSKDIIKRKNRLKIFEDHSKLLINSRKLLNIKKGKGDISNQSTFDQDIKFEKILNFNNNTNIINLKNSRSHNKSKDLLNKVRVFSLNENTNTITYEKFYGNKENKNKTLIDFIHKNFKENKNEKDTKYARCKKEIFEKMAKNIGIDQILRKNGGIKIKRNKNNIKINIKVKSQLDTENIIEKNEEKERNKTEMNVNKEDRENEENKKKEILEKTSNKSIEKDKKEKAQENINKNNDHSENNKKENIKKEELNTNMEISKKNEDKKENKDDNTDEIEVNEDKTIYFDVAKLPKDNQIPKEYINTIYKNLLTEEDNDKYPKPVYDKIMSQKEINCQMRSVLIDWIIDVHYKFGFTDETLFMTVLIIDRYISMKYISRIRFQLLGITAMLIACKHEEINMPKIDDFVYITDNAYTKDEVVFMENDILNTFNFDLLYPSPIKFFEFLSLKFNFDKKQILMGKYLMETFLIDLKWINYRPSVIACACAYVVMKFYKMGNYQESYNKKYYNLNENDTNNPKFKNEYDVKECAKDICFYVDNINKTNYLSCKKKYANKENENISLIVEGQNS